MKLIETSNVSKIVIYMLNFCSLLFIQLNTNPFDAIKVSYDLFFMFILIVAYLNSLDNYNWKQYFEKYFKEIFQIDQRIYRAKNMAVKSQLDLYLKHLKTAGFIPQSVIMDTDKRIL